MALVPAIVQCIPARFILVPTVILQPASTTPEPTQSPLARKALYCIRLRLRSTYSPHLRASSQRPACRRRAASRSSSRPSANSSQRAGEHLVGGLPDPGGSVAQHHAPLRLHEAAPLHFAARVLREHRRLAIRVAAGGAGDHRRIGDRAGVAHRTAFLVAGFRRPDRDQLDLARLGGPVSGLLARTALHGLLAHRHAGAVQPQLHRRSRGPLGYNHGPLVVVDLAPQGLGRSHLISGSDNLVVCHFV